MNELIVVDTLDDQLVEYEQNIKEKGVEFIWYTGEQLKKAKQKVIEITNNKYFPGFLEWADKKFGLKKSTVNKYIKAWEDKEEDLKKIWGNEKSGSLTSHMQIFLYNVWNTIFHPGYGVDCFGRQPAREIFNLVHYYMEEGDLVWDVFAGGGTFLDVCKETNRKCYSTDINPLRKEIVCLDVTKELPEITPQLIYLDPPYPVISHGHYTNQATDFSNMTIDEFFEKLDDLLRRISAKYLDTTIAYIIGGTELISGGRDFALESYKCLSRYFAMERRIIVPYSTQNYRPDQVNKAKEGKYMLNLYRDLFILKNGQKNQESERITKQGQL